MIHVTSIILAIVARSLPDAMDNYQNLIENSGLTEYSLMWVFSTLILPPLVEEMIFRGLIQNRELPDHSPSMILSCQSKEDFSPLLPVHCLHITKHKNSKADAFAEQLKELLSPLENHVLYLHLMGTDYRTIAELLGKSPKSVDNALQRIKTKAQKILP